jgi:hypothetical protein
MGPGDQPVGPTSEVHGEPDTIVIVAVVAGIVGLIILLWIWLG